MGNEFRNAHRGDDACLFQQRRKPIGLILMMVSKLDPMTHYVDVHWSCTFYYARCGTHSSLSPEATANRIFHAKQGRDE